MTPPIAAQHERDVAEGAGELEGQEPTDEGPSARIEIDLNDTQDRLRVDPTALVRLVRDILAIEGVDRAEISILLVDNPTIHAINREQLEHDWPTDVITFPLSDPEDEVLAGELVVSAEMARETAEEHGQDPWAELALYLVHGLLHLRGYDDHEEADIESMRRREGEVLALLGLENPFSPTASRASTSGPEPE